MLRPAPHGIFRLGLNLMHRIGQGIWIAVNWEGAINLGGGFPQIVPQCAIVAIQQDR